MKYLSNYFLLLLCVIPFASCSDDEPGKETDKELPDPAGTCTVSLYKDGTQKIDGIYFNVADNFVADGTMLFVNLGPKNGLADIISIPLTGWEETAKAEKGNGYIAFDPYMSEPEFIAMYISNNLTDPMGTITAYQVKYIKPFLGKDEPLSFESASVVFDENGGTQFVAQTNETIVPFKVKSVSEEWLTVSRTSYDSELGAGIRIEAQPAASPEDSNASIVLENNYGDETTITVTRSSLTQWDNDKIAGVVEEMYDNMYRIYTVTAQHFDFGVPSTMIFSDASGMDFVSEPSSYDWFTSTEQFTDRQSNNYVYTKLIWDNFYSIVNSANSILAHTDVEHLDPNIAEYIAQAYTMRAYAYYNLANFYGLSYATDAYSLCVPIVTEKNFMLLSKGIERSTVKDVYAQIISDLTNAIKCFSGEDFSSERTHIRKSTAYGLRARAYLAMNVWEEAINDAREAINTSGCSALSMEQAQHPGFNNMYSSNWMWGIRPSENSSVRVWAIINWPSHMGSFSYGYASVGAWRKINKKLFNSIPATDVRRNWFLDENCVSTGLSSEQQNYVIETGMPPYTQVKFAPYNDVVNTTENACDIPLMRVEEMYLIEAEATAMCKSPVEGKYLLQNFISRFRDPGYFYDGSVYDIQDEIWRQRRIEFWGEGFSLFDHSRLNKRVDRRGAGYSPEYVLIAEPYQLIYPIPLSAGKTNPALENVDFNYSLPIFVPDEEYNYALSKRPKPQHRTTHNVNGLKFEKNILP